MATQTVNEHWYWFLVWIIIRGCSSALKWLLWKFKSCIYLGFFCLEILLIDTNQRLEICLHLDDNRNESISTILTVKNKHRKTMHFTTIRGQTLYCGRFVCFIPKSFINIQIICCVMEVNIFAFYLSISTGLWN